MGQHGRDLVTACPERLLGSLGTMTELFRTATGCLQHAGWTYEPPTSTGDGAPFPLRTAPDTVIRWASSFSLLANVDETVWFLSRDDYSTGADGAFAWNEYEQLSLQAATTDDEAAAISRFWTRHLPCCSPCATDTSIWPCETMEQSSTERSPSSKKRSSSSRISTIC